MEGNYKKDKRENSKVEECRALIDISNTNTTKEENDRKRKRFKNIMVNSVIIGLKLIIGILIVNIVLKLWNLGFNIDGLNFFI